MRMVWAKPTNSAAVSPFMRKATGSAPIWAPVHSQGKTSAKTSRASLRVSETLWLAIFRIVAKPPTESGRHAVSHKTG